MNEQKLENPVLGYVVIAAALLVGVLSVSVFASDLAGTDLAGTDPNLAGTDPRISAHRGGEGCFGQELASRQNSDGCVREAAKRNHAMRHWVLGVRSQPSAAGCVITEVVHGSAAQRAGLAIGDTIITVGGTQVGWIRNELRMLADAVDASPARSTTVLVQKSTSGTVTPLTVQLATVNECLGHSSI